VRAILHNLNILQNNSHYAIIYIVNNLQKRIVALKKEKNAIILAHNYQTEEIFEVADYIGDSLELAQKATESKADIIILAGVNFMAESAKLLNPKKRVFIPSLSAVCPMAAMVNPQKLGKLKEKYPLATVVGYINTTAETKAMCDVCVTSANAVKICNTIKNDEIIFLPDKHLAEFVQDKLPKKKIIPFEGYCRVHAKASDIKFKKARKKYPKAKLLLHPETPKEFWKYADEILGTGGMIKYIAKSKNKTFLIGTEEAMCNRLRRDFPKKEFIPLLTRCRGMNAITLENILDSLKKEQYEINIPDDLFDLARNPLERMMKMS